MLQKPWIRLSAAVSETVLAFLLLRLLTMDNGVGFALTLLIIVSNSRHFKKLGWRIAVAMACGFTSWLTFTLLENDGLQLMVLPFALFCAYYSAQAIGKLNEKLQEQKKHSSDQTSHTELMNQVNNHLLTERGMDELQQLTLSCIYEVCGRPSILFVLRSGVFQLQYKHPSGLLIFPAEIVAAQAAYELQQPTGAGTQYCPDTAFRYIPLLSNGSVLAVIGILMDTQQPIDSELIHILEQILARASAAMERQKLSDDQQAIIMETEAERIRSNFLRAISHDFRTPLAGIIGACSALNGKDMQLDEAARQDLIQGIFEEATWLLQMVENLLSVTRVGTDGPKLNKELEPIEEVVAEAMNKSQKRFPELHFQVSLPEEFIMLPMDPTLIVQVLMNLIENAVKYSKNRHQIDICAEDKGSYVSFSVRDYGIGLAPDELDSLFQPSAVKAGDSGHGLGLGLSICRSIIRSHGGEISGRNHADSGAIFTFTLPKENFYE